MSQVVQQIRVKRLWELLLTLAFLLAGEARSEPWAAPGDLVLRHDVEVLADAGIITSPTTTWPLSWNDLARDLERVEIASLDSVTRDSFKRLQQRLASEMRTDGIGLHARLASAPESRTLRTFEDTPRESGEVEAGAQWMGQRFSYRLQATYAVNPDDGQDLRADGSYVGVAAGNWMIALGQTDRWWGPGWDGSLILSSNARPIPAVSVNRNASEAPDIRWLRWVGTWTTTVLMGQLEHDRDIPDALFFGARFAFRPIESLELGISRTAQWCGEERPCNLATFKNLLIGNDNSGVGVSKPSQPGNQLAGADLRWTGGPHGRRYAVYGQMIGEDEAGGTPSKYIGLFGAERWGYSNRLRGSWRLRLEAADTEVDFIGTPQFNVAYEHGVYTDGYRYRGRSIGHSLDGDGRLVGLTASLIRDDVTWNALLQYAQVNRDGKERAGAVHSVSQTAEDLWNVEVSHRRPLGPGLLDAGVGYERTEQKVGGAIDDTFELFAQWRLEF